MIIDHPKPLADTAFLDAITKMQNAANKNRKKKIAARTIIFCSFMAGADHLILVEGPRAAYVLAHEINFNTIMKSPIFAEMNFHIRRGDLYARRILKEGPQIDSKPEQ